MQPVSLFGLAVRWILALLSTRKEPEVLVLLLGLPMDRPALAYAEQHSKIRSKMENWPKLDVAGSSRAALSTMQTVECVRLCWRRS